MSLLGATTPSPSAPPRTWTGLLAPLLRVLARSGNRSGRVRGTVDGQLLTLDVTAPSGSPGSRTRTEVRRARGAAGAVAEPVAPARERRPGPGRAASLDGLRSRDAAQRAGRRLTSASASSCAERRHAPIPAFRVEMEFAGLHTTSWVTDTGEVVREESPLGLMTVRETAESAQGDGRVPSGSRPIMLEAAAVVPVTRRRSTSRATCAGCGCDSKAPTCPAAISHGAGQSVHGRRRRDRGSAGAAAPVDGRSRTRRAIWPPEPLLESDAPEIRAEADTRRPRRDRQPRPRRAADALRQRDARQEADRQPAVGARGAAHEGRRLQRAHRALRRDGARARHPGADRGRPGVRARRVLLPRVARGLHRPRDR